MKIYIPAISLGILVLFGCQNKSSEQATSITSPEATVIPPAPPSSPTTKAEENRQANVLQKDTMHAAQEEVVHKPASSAKDTFEAFFKDFERAVQQQDRAGFNQLLDPERGLYIIDTPGAVPHFTHVTNIAAFQRADPQQRSFFTIRETFKNCQLQEIKTLPKITCDGDGDAYAQSGCFVTDAVAFRKSNIYQYASLSPEEGKRIAQMQLLVNKTVLHTGSGFKFHFGQINGQWRLLFVDLMVPCSA